MDSLVSCVIHSIPPGCTMESTCFCWIPRYHVDLTAWDWDSAPASLRSLPPPAPIYTFYSKAPVIESLFDFLKVLNKTEFLRQKKEQKIFFYKVQDQRENS